VITENGVPDDARDSARPTVDHAGVEFLEQHLRAVHQAITDGCRITGCHAWSLLDNFEWAAGYTQRWGLVQVDFDTLQRPEGLRLLVLRRRSGPPSPPDVVVNSSRSAD